ncbi:MAG: gluconate 2-dehydrogenase subunit 3 family protein [Bryobacteraceae bacterium]
MSDGNPSRREVLRNIALSVTIGGMNLEAAQHVHQTAAEQKKAKGVYKPQFFNEHEYKTVRRLSELIVPADDVSPSALDAGAPEFIDLIAHHNGVVAGVFTSGLVWLDIRMNRLHGASFIDSQPAQQTELLDLIAFRKNAEKAPELAQGIRFFDWARRMVVDAYYTSPVGIKDIGYLGNKGMTVFEVPAESIEYALDRSPFKASP